MHQERAHCWAGRVRIIEDTVKMQVIEEESSMKIVTELRIYQESGVEGVR